MRTLLALPTLLALATTTTDAATVSVSNDAQLRDALRSAKAGTVIEIAPGTYRGNHYAANLKGTPNAPIVIRGRDPKQPPILKGGSVAFHFSKVEHLELRNLRVESMADNGINIDDGGNKTSPSHHVTVQNLSIVDVGPKGNHDGLKLSGVADFRVESCIFERWGSGGSGIDMVGCERGEIIHCTFRHSDTVGDNGVQAKGGSNRIVVRRCRFEHSGQRAINIGGSTGLQYFRPEPRGFEAKDIRVEDCMILGSHAAIAFVGVNGSSVEHNTIISPLKYAIRILQETQGPAFVPCRNGRFASNLIAFRSDQMIMPINIGPGTAPETFTLQGNAWYCLDTPGRSKPRLPSPITESDGIHGVDPGFRDPSRGDYTRPPGHGPDAGARTEPGR